jgi:predicted nucleotidyltransferase
MRREKALHILEAHRQELREHFGVKSLRLFGSVARDEASEQSDVDVVVDFEETPSLFGFLRLQGYLQDLLGTKVDLVTETGLRERARPFVEKDAVNVA